MTEIAVRAEDLGKNYLLGQMNSYRTIREAIAGVPAKLRHGDGAGRGHRTSEHVGAAPPRLRGRPR